MSYQIVGAGAGSGKTWHIQETLKNWVIKNEIRPERMLAVTFTEAAASELKGRIRGALLAAGRLEEATAIERAYVSTIHALGRRILTEHAFAAGLSPSLRLIEDAEAELLLRRAIARTDALDEITGDLEAHGYVWSRSASAIGAFHNDLRAALARLNDLGAHGDDPVLPARAATALEEEWPETVKDGKRLDRNLRHAIEAMLAAFPDGIIGSGNNKTAKDAFISNLRDLKHGTKDGAYTDWAWWQRLQALRLTKRGSPTPEGYDELGEAVINAAQALSRHPGPKAEAAERLKTMLTGAQQVRREYTRAKERLGVIDFGDMIGRAEALLREHPDVISTMMEGIDCVIVDEFQDTNPVQFALLSHLVNAAPRVLLVGDGKQAIMGFQGADARLAAALAAKHPEATHTLDTNRRSVPDIMNFVNELGQRLFDDYQPLTPFRKAYEGTPIEIFRITSKNKTKDGEPLAQGRHHIADRIKSLLDEEREIVDRATAQKRPLQSSDIAILCRSHDKAQDYAESLTELGIAVDLDEQGWFTSEAISVARAALAFIADPTDSFAAVFYLTHGPEALPIEDALKASIDGSLNEHRALRNLRALSEDANGWTVPRTVAALIAEGGLGEWADGLDDPARGHADLLRLSAEAIAFEQADPVTRAASGVFGWDPRSFLAWLAIAAEAGNDSRPNPDGANAGSGVKIATWHAAKGLEWPVVCVTGLDTKISERPNTLRIEYDAWDEPTKLLDHATIHIHPNVASTDVRDHFANARREAAAGTERCLAYVAFTRARDLLILEWPDYVKPDADTLSNLLMNEGGLEIGESSVTVGETSFTARVSERGGAFPESFDTPLEASNKTAVRPGRKATSPPRGAPLFVRPSDGGEEAGLWSLGTASLGSPLPSDSFADASVRGTALHLAMKVLLTAPERASELAAATGLSDETISVLSEQTAGLQARLVDRGFPEIYTELPLDVQLPHGPRIRGTADLLARSADGSRAALIDYKSPAPENATEAAAPYLGQLSAYAQAISAVWPRTTITRAGIHFLGSGTLVWGVPS